MPLTFEAQQQEDPPEPAASLATETSSQFAQALALHQAGRLAAAEPLYRAVLQTQPSHFDSLHLLGLLYYHRKDYAEAVRQIDLALLINANAASAHNSRGAALKELNRLDEALVSYGNAIALDPAYADAFYNRANVLKEQRRFEEALADYDRAIALKPDHVDAINNRGTTLRALKRFEEALANYDQAIALRPGKVDALHNRGNALNDLNRFEEALSSFDQAIALRPNLAEGFNNRGIALLNLRRIEEALASFDQAIALSPSLAESFNNRGIALLNLPRVEEALASFDQAIAVDPNHAEGFRNRAFCKLLVGRWIDGWTDYEWRWKTHQMAAERRNFKQPQWFGSSDIAGKTLLLHAEQGFGDTIMMARYIARVVKTGARVVLEAPSALTPLLAEIDMAQLVTRGQPLPAFDRHCPLMSLPLAFGTTVNTIQADIPYLSVPPVHAQKWLGQLPKSDRPRVGIVWSGSPDHIRDRERSIALRRVLPLLSRTDLQFFGLQKFLREEDAAILRNYPQIENLGDAIESFADTAAIISALDLVISVDTSVAHLAGALGKPVWILLPFTPDWRWLLDRHDSPWYPTARLFRQSHVDDWDGVIAEISQELSLFAARHPN
jgi:tetratricopeptide (TPR) repeat protein